MEKFTQKQLRHLCNSGVAIDVTNASFRNEIIKESYTKIGYAEGVYGCSGLLLKGESGQLYAVCSRTTAIYIF